jgi:hypothetical protein
MADAHEESTWGANYGAPGATPGQGMGPHVGYPAQSPRPFTPSPSYPMGQTPYPVVTPQPHQPPVAPPSFVPPVPAPGAPLSYGGPAPASTKIAFVTRLVERGVRGELFRQPWFHNLRATQPDTFVYVSFGVAVVMSVLLSIIPSNFLATALTDALWLGLAYLYFAMGTKLAHQFLLWGICVAGGVVMLLRIWSTISLLSIDASLMRYTGRYLEPTGLLVVLLLLDLASVVLLGLVGMQLHREIAKLSRP